MSIAKYIRDLVWVDWGQERRETLYKLKPPLKTTDGKYKYKYAVVCSCWLLDKPEVRTFVASRKGEIPERSVMLPTIHGTLSHAAALRQVGYEITNLPIVP